MPRADADPKGCRPENVPSGALLPVFGVALRSVGVALLSVGVALVLRCVAKVFHTLALLLRRFSSFGLRFSFLFAFPSLSGCFFSFSRSVVWSPVHWLAVSRPLLGVSALHAGPERSLRDGWDLSARLCGPFLRLVPEGTNRSIFFFLFSFLLRR